MPNSAEILAALAHIATTWSAVAIAWHVAIGGLLVSLLIGWRPPHALLGGLLTLPLLSVSAFAWLAHTAFNGVVFAVAAAVLLTMSAIKSPGRFSLSPFGYRLMGLAMIAYGLGYPHFLQGGTGIRYLYAAPTGLVPCPTLSVVVGFALLGNGLASRGLALFFAAIALFYGLFGVLHLAVYLDAGLVVGAIALVALAFQMPAHRTFGREREAHERSG